MTATAIILARTGSKGVANKCVRDVAGRPCIAWTIDAAQRASAVSRTIVTTDDPQAQRIARDMNADVVARPADLATDTAAIDDAARHAVQSVSGAGVPPASPRGSRPGRPEQYNNPAPIIILYANVPIRPPDLIDRAVNLLLSTGADSVQSYATVGKHHPWWTAVVDPGAGGQVRPWEGDTLFHNTHRRQDLPPAHIPDGGVTALTRRALFGDIPGVPPGPHAFLGLDRRAVITGEGDVIDIDSGIDLLVADAILRTRAAEGAAA